MKPVTVRTSRISRDLLYKYIDTSVTTQTQGPFQIDDPVQLMVPVGFQTGTIEGLTLGYTVSKTSENREIIVPNSVMASQAIIKSAV